MLAGRWSWGSLLTMAFSHDGRWVAMGGEDGGVQLWDVTNPQVPPHVLASRNPSNERKWSIRALAFSPDGRWLVAGSIDHTARVWDMTNPLAAPGVLAGHGGSVQLVAFSPNGRWLVTVSTDDRIRLWTWPVDDLIDLACRMAGRNLSLEEWQQYVQNEVYRTTCAQWPTPPSVVSFLDSQARSLALKGTSMAELPSLRGP